MNKLLGLGLCLALLLCSLPAPAQYLFNVTFRGTSYSTNSSGKIIATPITEQTWLQQGAAETGADPASLAVVYHINGSGLGDTIEVVNASSGVTYALLFGLYFGDFDNGENLGRTALTNAPYTEVRRVDYMYNGCGSNCLFSPYALGGSFTTKRFLHDPNGKLSFKADGELEYLARPRNHPPPEICFGRFTTTKAFVAH